MPSDTSEDEDEDDYDQMGQEDPQEHYNTDNRKAKDKEARTAWLNRNEDDEEQGMENFVPDTPLRTNRRKDNPFVGRLKLSVPSRPSGNMALPQSNTSQAPTETVAAAHQPGCVAWNIITIPSELDSPLNMRLSN